ncbi:glycosyltransferase family 4 protein [Pseudomonas fuscovaginae UPB0736]|uniref:glycosyltransferase family 4 protein n=1 Tax=Pseudomonas asplenii TaxID=53407 RepID=UPI0002D47BC2|nr:glycosyltransferase family 4 protein [Pseudomonas fuscovaginae]UUQ66753.1 glycosyltransferase family 4 protein [Pseudomonas fuscovaginae UPB0736]
MTEKPLIVTWQPVLTDHQAFTYEELSRQAETPVLAYVLTMEDATRRAQGWRDTQVESIERRLIPERGAFSYCYRKMRGHRHDVHLFGSAFQGPKMLYCLLLAMFFRVEFYIVSEPYSPIASGYFSDDLPLIGRLKAALRPCIYKIYTMIFKSRLSGIFSISRRAVDQYSKAGVVSEKLFPFGYFVPSAGNNSGVKPKSLDGSMMLNLVYVGSLISTKGLDLLISAVHGLNVPVRLDVYGPGDPSLFAFDEEKIRYCGTIPFGNAQEVISNYDVLVLPSRYDGWGVVVNEALCAGVPVICSDQVGARVLVEKFGAGAVFDSADPEALCSAIRSLCAEPERLLSMRSATCHAAVAIQPDVAAGYMLAVVRAKPEDKAKVVSPWYSESSSS